jgi:Ca-activated chloride channel family protein
MFRTWLMFPALILTSSIVAAQEVHFTSGVDLVHLGVTVLSRDNELVTELTAEDFELYEDGLVQEIQYFSRGLSSDAETMPMHLGILLDASGSMDEQDGIFAKTAAIKFLNTLTYAHDITLVDFDTEVRVGRYSQADFPRLIERIRGRRPDGWTALYDALGVYLDGAFDQDGRKVLLLYTDGSDTRSRLLYTGAIDLLRASDVTVYAIGFQKYIPSTQRDVQRMRLEQLVAATGGRCYFPTDVDQLDEIYKQITDELEARYSIGYSSDNLRTDGIWRKIEIKIKDSRVDLGRLTVRSRQGYFAPYIEEDNPDR